MPFHHTVGIDVSKARLDAHRLPDGETAEFDNAKAGFRKLIKWSGDGVECIAYEASGPYHRDLEQALLQHGLPAVRVNPWQARRFAQASGRRVKTDRVDARMLASMALVMPLRPTQPLSETQRCLQDLQQAREALMRDRGAVRNRLAQYRLPLLRKQAKARLRQLERQIKALDRELADQLGSDPDLERKARILKSIPGVSSVTAAGLLATVPELADLRPRALASLAGLAPVTRQSGTWQGRSFIQGGRFRVRQLLFMPALAASRCNPDLAAFYQRLVQAGKPPKLALAAVMRKLLLLAAALLREDREWSPVKPPAAACQAAGGRRSGSGPCWRATRPGIPGRELIER